MTCVGKWYEYCLACQDDTSHSRGLAQGKAWKDLKPEIVEGGHFLFYNHGNLDFFFN